MCVQHVSSCDMRDVVRFVMNSFAIHMIVPKVISTSLLLSDGCGSSVRMSIGHRHNPGLTCVAVVCDE